MKTNIIRGAILITAFVCVASVFAMGVSASQEQEAAGDIPGVTTETKEDGTKVVTINLSEIDESKLPEKYEAEVILEAPVMSMISGNLELIYEDKTVAEFKDDVLKLKRKNITPDGVFLKGGAEGVYPDGLNVSIDENGNIYILDMYNRRIQKFNSEGKHIRNIPIDEPLEIHFDRIKGSFPIHKNKNKIAAGGGKVYVMDTAQGVIEELNEEGDVIERIKVPKEASGKWWADEKGMGIGDVVLKGERGAGEVKISQLAPKRIEVLKDKKKVIIAQKSPTASEIKYMAIDNKNNTYIYFFASKGKENGIIKLSKEESLLAKINEGKYIFGNDWKDSCGNKPKPLLKNWAKSMIFDDDGNLYFLQSVCCKNEKDCVGKIRIVKVSGSE